MTATNTFAEKKQAISAKPTTPTTLQQTPKMEAGGIDGSGLERVVGSYNKPTTLQHESKIILDDGVKYSNVDLLKHLPKDYLIRKLSEQVAHECDLPKSTTFLNIIGIYSSMACKKWVVEYPNCHPLPIGLYIVAEQPSGVGKTRCQRAAQKPFFEIKSEVLKWHKEQMAELEAKEEPTDEEKSEMDLLESLNLSLHSKLFFTNATPEAVEEDLNRTSGFFAAVSSEQGLFNSMLGLSYANGESNNDLLLYGFDGGYNSSSRVKRGGYTGHVVGSCVSFAQLGSIEKVIAQSKGSGLAERFLMLCEPHQLGERDHTKKVYPNDDLMNAYAKKCSFTEELFKELPKPFSELTHLQISEAGWLAIGEYRNQIEPDLKDGGKFSHDFIRGAASKIDMQIMKIAANLYLLEREDIGYQIPDEIVASAIRIADDLLQTNLALAKAKGLMGEQAEYQAILNLFENDLKPRTQRQIIQSRSKVAPFKDCPDNKSERIRKILADMVKNNVLYEQILDGISSYGLNQ